LIALLLLAAYTTMMKGLKRERLAERLLNFSGALLLPVDSCRG